MGREDEGQGESRLEPAQQVAAVDEGRQRHGEEGGGAHDRMLGKAVRKKARRREEHDEGQQDAGVDQGGQADLGGAVVDLEDRVLDDDLVPEVDHGVDENHAQVGQEAADAEEPASDAHDWAPSMRRQADVTSAGVSPVSSILP
jgi:hypothetical protein